MSGQFPDRIPSSGPFSNNSDSAGLGSSFFSRSALISGAVTVDTDTETVDVTFATPVPVAPGTAAVFEVDLDAWCGTNSGTSGTSPSLAIGLQLLDQDGAVTGSASSRSFGYATGSAPTGRGLHRNCNLTAGSDCTAISGFRLTYLQANPGTNAMVFPTNQSEYRATRIG